MFRNITIIGGGAWGSALAISLSKKIHATLVVRNRKEAEEMTATRVNSRYLPEAIFPPEVSITADLTAAARSSDLILIATPTSAFEEVLTEIAELRLDLPVLWGCKGFCPKSGQPLSEGAEKILGRHACYGAFSGPSFAAGLAANHPTAVVVATNRDYRTTLRIATALSSDSLRIYGNSDLIGVQICGAIKNIYAIAAGIIDGCGWGENTRAAMLTRAVAEARRYLSKHDCKRSTLMGLSGFGDIYLTCGSRLSRNYQIGMALSRNVPLQTAIAELGHVAEGINTTHLIHQRAAILEIEMPIVAAVHAVLTEAKSPRDCAALLMGRNIKYEKSRAE